AVPVFAAALSYLLLALPVAHLPLQGFSWLSFFSSRRNRAVPPLRYIGDSQLMQPQRALTEPEIHSPEVQANLDMLLSAMRKYGGIGIAAPQVGWWVRAMVFGIEGENKRYPQAENVPLQFWINPEIVWSSKDRNWMWEGCLSVPGMRGWVGRPTEVRMTGLDRSGFSREVHLVGLPARIAQHEIDHLDGLLFPERVNTNNNNNRLLLPNAAFDAKETWRTHWPSPGSWKTALGQLSDAP
ncbi:unnamed protein product, partial [Polarella glacialis]